MKENLKPQLRFINIDNASPLHGLKTPTASKICLTERSINNASPITNRKLTTERRIVSIDLKVKPKQPKNIVKEEAIKEKKIIKVQRRTESVELGSTRECSRGNQSCFSSGKKSTGMLDIDLMNQKMNQFEELGFSLSTSREIKDKSWDEIVDERKQQLYSQLYKMDKKILAIERDLNSKNDLTDKNLRIDMIKKKGIIKEMCPAPIQIHSNIYRAGKNKI